MSVTIDDVERAAWHVAAEPIPARMDDLLQVVQLFAEPRRKDVPAGIREKLCRTCKLVKTLPDHFQRDNSQRDGWRYRCKECESHARRAKAAGEARRARARPADYAAA